MQKTYIQPRIDIIVPDKEFLAGNTQDSTGEQDPGTILGNQGFFDDEEENTDGKITGGATNVWDD